MAITQDALTSNDASTTSSPAIESHEDLFFVNSAGGSNNANSDTNAVLSRLDHIVRMLDPSWPEPNQHDRHHHDRDHEQLQEQQEQQQQQQQQHFTGDLSPKRSLLQSKISYVYRILFGLEKYPQEGNAKPAPPASPSRLDDEVFELWCAATGLLWYKIELFKLLESLRDQEENERRALRAAMKEDYNTGENNPHRKRLRSKVQSVKTYILKTRPKSNDNGDTADFLPPLPQDALDMDLDVFLIWCLHSPKKEYEGLRRPNRYAASCRWPHFDSLYQELGCLITTLLEKNRLEGEYVFGQEQTPVEEPAQQPPAPVEEPAKPPAEEPAKPAAEEPAKPAAEEPAKPAA